MNIRKKGDSYYITVYDGSSTKGKTIRHYTTYKPDMFYQNGKPRSQAAIDKDVEEFARQFENKIKRGESINDEDFFFEDFAENIWKPEWAETHLSQRCVEDYSDKLKRIFYRDLGKKKIGKIQAVDIQRIINHEIRRGLSIKTVQREFCAIRSVFKFAFKMSYIESNPCERVDLPRIKKRQEVECFTPDQAIAFLGALDTEFIDTYKEHYVIRRGKKVKIEEYTEKHTVSTMWKLYFVLALVTGMRRGEMCALTWRDIDRKNRTIDISKSVSATKAGILIKDPKTVESNRIITYPEICDSYFEEWYQEEKLQFDIMKKEWKGISNVFEDNNIFIQKNGKMVFLTSPSSKLKEIIERYNKTVPKDEWLPMIKLHALRHSCASLMINQGVDIVMVSRRLGHSKISTTLDIYTHRLERNDQIASAALDGLLRKKEE